MRILKAGKTISRKFTCPECGCVFVIAKGEARRCGFGDLSLWAICPCGKGLNFESGELFSVEAPAPCLADNIFARGVPFVQSSKELRAATIGDRIREARLRLNMRQRDLAASLGCVASMIGQYESGARTPKIENVKRLAEALSVSPEWLLTGQSAGERRNADDE